MRCHRSKTWIQPQIDWHARAACFQPRTARCSSTAAVAPRLSGATFDCISPIDGRVLARWPPAMRRMSMPPWRSGARRLRARRLVAPARRRERKQVLLRFADLMRAHREELALLETLDMGKPIADSLAVDVPSTAELHPVVRRGHRQDLRRGGAHGPELAGAGDARTDGRGGRHRAVEFPDDHGGVEDRPGRWRRATRWCSSPRRNRR